ncbi:MULTISPECIES: transglutaminase-like domain-containing protein [Pontibacillus]|uniref:Transglutaminase-like domain-containing protein n=1 Tax=Pontibacillus chungwhensis TaxID=265426 RepID=A0ABY8UY71_9BACI|nr:MULTISPECIES: transglutaminase-like domain-containing protein [Pontibacillus]MCD5325995.1 transglutaminase-like domain-containing protein [Pontibacillus sp. HN14]WIF98449.1 transglutaminase-like domain-containing protein [Pontibacillus chungwhensis]
MANDPIERNQAFFRGIVYLCGFLLFWEWLRPLEQITDTANIAVFVVYAAFCFFLSFIRLPWFLSMPLKLVGLAFVLDGLFIGERFLSGEWFRFVYEHIQFNIEVMVANQWWQMTPLFRSMLFLLLLWLMSYLLYYWFVVAKRTSFFVILTIVYVTILDTFTIYDGKGAIIRTFLISLVVMGLSSFVKEMEKESITIKGRRVYQAWIVPLVVVILFASLIGYAAPKKAPQWPDPVPFIQSAANGVGGSGGKSIQKVGYGTNDERLGGSFVQDDTPVFQAVADGEHYWRIETKDVYTGKGWIRSSEGNAYEQVASNEIDLGYFSDEVKRLDKTATIAMNDAATFSKLVYPYGIQNVLNSGADTLVINPTTGEIIPQVNGETFQLKGYEISYAQPSFSFSQLSESGTDDPPNIDQAYTQLPESLPTQVRELAEGIVEGSEDRYEKARAVEEYFQRNGFEYSTKNVPVPDEGEDYTSQFLFDSKVGYCDNFSTSMVVLLRSVGVPARWAKGFTGGEQIDTVEVDGELKNVYEVTSANAHSWVEVYFPDIGWVAFEPTKGFGNHTDFYLEDTGEDDEETSDVDENLQDQLDQNQQQQPELDEQEMAGKNDGSGGDGWNITIPTWAWVLFVVLILAALWMAYRYRYHLMAKYYRRKYIQHPGQHNYETAYEFLLKVLDKKEDLNRSNGQTLQEFARSVDEYYRSQEMGQLTYHYERLVYQKGTSQHPWAQMRELWENLIKKTLS